MVVLNVAEVQELPKALFPYGTEPHRMTIIKLNIKYIDNRTQAIYMTQTKRNIHLEYHGNLIEKADFTKSTTCLVTSVSPSIPDMKNLKSSFLSFCLSLKFILIKLRELIKD